MCQGDPAAGIFALAFRDELRGVAAGGRYTEPEAVLGNLVTTRDGGRTWQLASLDRRTQALDTARVASAADSDQLENAEPAIFVKAGAVHSAPFRLSA